MSSLRPARSTTADAAASSARRGWRGALVLALTASLASAAGAACVSPLAGLCIGQECAGGLYVELAEGERNKLSPGTYSFRVSLTDDEAGLTDVAHEWSCDVTSDGASMSECETGVEIEPGHIIEAFVAGDETRRLWLRAYQGPDNTRTWTGHASVHVTVTRDEDVLHEKTYEPDYKAVSDDECATCLQHEANVDLSVTGS